ncbi:hypothetical protein SDC9_156236 [bioreactor metagenome]|uniref:Uncharacterized protein n=1 Tax=bioreactor metagenome TaxID=1076179 RepID=A0A645F3M9_9ZZZZ
MLTRIEPVARRPAFLGGGDLHRLPALERRIQGDKVTIHLGAATTVPQIGVQTIGEVNRRGATRQIHHPALRRQHIQRVVQ